MFFGLFFETPLTRNPYDSKYFKFPLAVRVIGVQLYSSHSSTNLFVLMRWDAISELESELVSGKLLAIDRRMSISWRTSRELGPRPPLCNTEECRDNVKPLIIGQWLSGRDGRLASIGALHEHVSLSNYMRTYERLTPGQMHMRVVWELYESCVRVVRELCESCMRAVSELYELYESCIRVVWELYESCMRAEWPDSNESLRELTRVFNKRVCSKLVWVLENRWQCTRISCLTRVKVLISYSLTGFTLCSKKINYSY